MKFKRLAPLALLTLALFASLFNLVQRNAAAATFIVDDNLACPGATFPTISAAVVAASPGDTIKVCAGTYNELVNVNKQLTLLGAQAGQDARTRPGLPANESVVNGLAGSTSFYVTANGVVIDGFTVQGNTNANLFGAGIVLGAGTTGSQILNNIVQNNIVGLFLANSGGQQALIQYNLFRANTQPGPAGGHAIYSDEFVAGGAVKNVSIDSNKFDANTWGIGISNTNTAAPYTGLSITANNFTNNSRGMYFYTTQSSSIVGNTITGVGAGRYAIGLFDADSGFTIKCNTIQNNGGRGIWVGSDFGNPDSNIAANDNIIANNATAGVEVDPGSYSGVLNAERNWWGSPTGPTTLSNPGGTGDKIIDPDGVVDYTPFLTAVPDADNDGIIDACDAQVGPPTNKDQCKNGGWQSFNAPRTFKNQGDCIQYVNTGK